MHEYGRFIRRPGLLYMELRMHAFSFLACACLLWVLCVRTFFDQDTNDTVRVEDEVGALGVLVADDGGAGLELLGLGQEDNLLWWLIGLGEDGR